MASKMSKKDQDPQQINKDREGLAKILSKKTNHFEIHSYVVSQNVRGQVLSHFDIGTRTFMDVMWETGMTTVVEHPMSKRGNQ